QCGHPIIRQPMSLVVPAYLAGRPIHAGDSAALRAHPERLPVRAESRNGQSLKLWKIQVMGPIAPVELTPAAPLGCIEPPPVRRERRNLLARQCQRVTSPFVSIEAIDLTAAMPEIDRSSEAQHLAT